MHFKQKIVAQWISRKKSCQEKGLRRKFSRMKVEKVQIWTKKAIFLMKKSSRHEILHNVHVFWETWVPILQSEGAPEVQVIPQLDPGLVKAMLEKANLRVKIPVQTCLTV